MIMRYVKIFLAGLLIIFCLTECRQSEGIKNKSSNISGSKRLVVTNSDALEMLIGLGAEENIVGISDAKIELFFEKTKDIQLIGNWRNPNIEAIINLKPDIVVTYKQWPEAAGFDDKLKPFNIAVERMDCYHLSEYASDIQRLASFLGKEAVADTIISDFNKIIDMIKTAVKDIEDKKRVYFEFSDFSALGPGTGGDDILTLINAINIAKDLVVQYPKISTEWLLEEDPDIIIKVITADTITDDMYQRILSRPGWEKLNAVKNNKVYLILSDLCAGPRAMIGGQYIGKWCYPDRFSTIDPDSVHMYWLNKHLDVDYQDKYVLTSEDRL
jgi:iron complex transport system substrate-binding protein